jgi:hypothetical protein
VKISRSESGYVMTTRVLSVRTRHNGDGYDDPYLGLRVGKEKLRYHYDAGGTLLAVDGLAALTRAMRETVPTRPTPMRPFSSELEAFAVVEAQWQRIGVLAGSTVAIGETVEKAYSRPA